MRGASSARPGWEWFSRLIASGVLLTYLWHLSIIARVAVDVPHWDEWSALRDRALPAGFTWSWVFEPHNEHRVVFTKLLIWLLYWTTGWNVALNIVVNFLIYGTLLGSIFWLGRRRWPEVPSWVLCGFLWFLLTTAAYENHFWGFQSCFHFSLLFFVAAAALLFEPRQRTLPVIAGAALGGASVFALSTGVAAAAVLLVPFGLFKLQRALCTADSAAQRAAEILQWIGASGIIAASIGAWAATTRDLGDGLAPPWAAEWWRFFAMVVAWGFGIDTGGVPLGLGCLALVLAPLIGLARRHGSALRSSHWTLITLVLGTLGALAAIASGRASGWPELARAPRYNEISGLLVPLTAIAWWLRLDERPRWRVGVLVALWLACAVAYANHVSAGVYHSMAIEREAGIDAARAYYAGRGNGYCPTIYPSPMPAFLDAARRLRLSFYRKIEATRPP